MVSSTHVIVFIVRYFSSFDRAVGQDAFLWSSEIQVIVFTV